MECEYMLTFNCRLVALSILFPTRLNSLFRFNSSMSKVAVIIDVEVDVVVTELVSQK